MSKRLIVVLVAAFVLGIAFSAYAEVQNVKVSGDITALGIWRDMTLKGDTTLGHTESALASITRVRVDADLTDNVMTTVRLINERYWGRTSENVASTFDGNAQIDLDLAYVTLKEFLYSPLSLTIGRQELHFGNDMVVGNAFTNSGLGDPSSALASVLGRDPDLSMRKSFDAIRATLNFDPLVVDAVYAKITTNGSLRIGNDDQNLYGINANYKIDSKTTVEGYWFEKNTGKQAIINKKSDRVDTIGARAVVAPIDNLTVNAEAAYQFGRRAPASTDPTANEPTVSRSAWAGELAATYNWKNVMYTPSTTLLACHFSGNRPQNAGGAVNNLRGAYKGWDPMFENQTFGNIANAMFMQTNVNLMGGIVTANPMKDVILKGEYYAYWWDKKFIEGTVLTSDRGDTLNMTGRMFAGQELDLTATYNYTEDVQFNLLGGWFFPGASFAKSNDSAACEVIGSMKVTF